MQMCLWVSLHLCMWTERERERRERELQDCQHPPYVIWLFIRLPSGMRGLCHSSKRLDIMEIAKWIVLSEPECIIQMQIVFLLIKACESLRRITANAPVILIKFISASKTSILTFALMHFSREVRSSPLCFAGQGSGCVFHTIPSVI